MNEFLPKIEKHEPTPIEETSESVSYLGVKLEKAKDITSPLVPKKENYKSYVEDEFTLELQKMIAISWQQGDPIMIEGGTSLGKTTTIRKMCADLGWEIHYNNLNGATDVESLMGRYIPNSNKKTNTDPEFIFSDGKITSGLRQEKGKFKVIVLDEFNAAKPDILIRLHEVIDALEKGEDVILSEDASEAIPTSKHATKIVALVNPPGGGYIGRSPLDPAQLRRWVYQKLPDQLPEKTFLNYLNALSGKKKNSFDLPEENFTHSNDRLTIEQLRDIDGLDNLIVKYHEFHRSAQSLLKSREIAADQPQKFSFDDRMEPARVINYVRNFYNGDINKTFQEALRYYYLNKLSQNLDKQKLEELVRLVEYRIPLHDKRRNSLADLDSNTSIMESALLNAYKAEIEKGNAVVLKFNLGTNPKTGEEQWQSVARDERGRRVSFVIDKFSSIDAPTPGEAYICNFGRTLVDSERSLVQTVFLSAEVPRDWMVETT